MHEALETIMNEAYKGWADDASYETFISSLDAKHRICVLMGNLNYQVGNGGFIQWVDNGYATQYDAVVNALTEINTPTTLKVLELVKYVGTFINKDNVKDTGFGGNYWDESEYERDEDCSCGGNDEDCNVCGGDGVIHNEGFSSPDLDAQDTAFYAIDDQFLSDVEAYLLATYK